MELFRNSGTPVCTSFFLIIPKVLQLFVLLITLENILQFIVIYIYIYITTFDWS
jgi:hypothetical protein